MTTDQRTCATASVLRYTAYKIHVEKLEGNKNDLSND